MHVTDLLHGYALFAAANPVLLLATLLAVGAAFGAVKIKGISLGPAAILFAALALSAANSELALPAAIGTLGLALFAYTVGLTAGPTFFSALRSGGRAVALVVVALGAARGLTVVLGKALGLSGPLLVGVYQPRADATPRPWPPRPSGSRARSRPSGTRSRTCSGCSG